MPHAEALVRLTLPVVFIGGWLNNTPLVLICIPIVASWSRKAGLSPGHLFMPLSFASILGGVCTLIGTSTNIVVAGALAAAVAAGDIAVPEGDPAPKIGMFTLSWVGVPVMIVGLAYILLFGRKLLPRDPALEQALADEPGSVDLDNVPPPEGYMDKPVDEVKRMLGLNERVASVDTPLGPESDKSLLDTIADTHVSDPSSP